MPLILPLQDYLPNIASLCLKITSPLVATFASMMLFIDTTPRLVAEERALYVHLLGGIFDPKVVAEVLLPDRFFCWILQYYICVLGLMLATWMARPTPWMWNFPSRRACSIGTLRCMRYLHSWDIQSSIASRKSEGNIAEALPDFEAFLELRREPAPATATTEGERGGECIVCWSDDVVPLALPEYEHLVCRDCLMRLKENTLDYCLCPYCRRPLFSIQATEPEIILEDELILEIELLMETHPNV